jgi:hypothetical protein
VSTRSPEEAYRALQRLARADGRTTQQTFELYVHERFLARLANSRFAERLVLKGGMLLAALDARRATRDADMLARGIDNDVENLRDVVSEIAAAVDDRADHIAAMLDGPGTLEAAARTCVGQRRDLLATLTSSACAFGEALSLRWRDVDLAGGTTVIQAASWRHPPTRGREPYRQAPKHC